MKIRHFAVGNWFSFISNDSLHLKLTYLPPVRLDFHETLKFTQGICNISCQGKDMTDFHNLPTKAFYFKKNHLVSVFTDISRKCTYFEA